MNPVKSSKSPKYVLFGDSHAIIYAQAVRRIARREIKPGPMRGGRAFYKPFFRIENGQIVFFTDVDNLANRKFLETAQELDVPNCTGRLIVSLGLAAGSFASARFWTGRDFGADPAPDRQYLSYAVLREMIAEAQAPIVDFYRACHQRGLLVAALDGPPLQQRLRTFRAFPAEKVFEMAEMWQRPMRTLLAELGCPIITAPDVTDEKGYLREEFQGHDWVHANIAFGERMIQALLAHLAGRDTGGEARLAAAG